MNSKTQQQEIPLHFCQVLEEEYQSLHEKLVFDKEGAESPDEARARSSAEPNWAFQEGDVDTEKLAETLRDSYNAWEKRRAHAGGWKETVKKMVVSPRVAFGELSEKWKENRRSSAEGEGSVGASGGGRDESGGGESVETGASAVAVLPVEESRPRASAGATGAVSDAELMDVEDLPTYLAIRYRGLWEKPQADRVAILNFVLQDKDEGGEDNGPRLTVFRKARFERVGLREETRGLLETGWPSDGATAFESARGAQSDLWRFRRLLLEDAFPVEIERVYDRRMNEAVRKIHDLEKKRSAVCLSGGGIRSGTFALGVLQSLARRGVLGEFDYLSTVSGGGYVGGWLTAWIHRHPRGLQGVIDELNGTPSRDSIVEPEPQPLRHLRDFSNFITPRAGILSADSWTFIIIYLRNLLLNWVVLIPLLASVLMIPRVANAVVLARPSWHLLIALVLCGALSIILLKPDKRTGWWMLALTLVAGVFIVGGWWRSPGAEAAADRTTRAAYIMGTLFGAGTLLSGYALAFMRLNRPSNRGVLRPGSYWDKQRDQNSFLWMCLLPLTVAASLLTIFWAWFRPMMARAGTTDVDIAVPVQWLDSGPAKSLAGWLPWGDDLLDLTKRAADWLLKDWSEFGSFMLYGALVGVASLVIYALLAASSWWGARGEVVEMTTRRPRKFAEGIFKNMGNELIVTLLASLLGAVLLYVAAVKIPVFYDPVVATTQTYADQTVSGALLPHTEWRRTEIYTYLAFPIYLLVFFLGLTLFTGFTSRRSEKPPRERRRLRMEGGLLARIKKLVLHPFDRTYVEDEDREWLARASAWIFIVAGGWLLVGGLVLFGPLLYFELGNWLPAAGGASGLLALLGGGSSRTPGGAKDAGKLGWLQTIGVNVLVLAAFVFFCCIIIAVSILTGTVIAWLVQYLPAYLLGQCAPDARFVSYLSGLCADGGTFAALRGYVELPARGVAAFSERYPFQSRENVFRVLHFPPWLYLLLLALALQLFGRVFAGLINLNKFSLHAGYRDRIIRAFLGASRIGDGRDANPFTGFDPSDDLHMGALRPWLLRESDFAGPGELRRFADELNDPPEGSMSKFLREEIAKMEGESRKYFKDPPASVEYNPSFRAALFADLNTILQGKDLPDPDALKPDADAPKKGAAGGGGAPASEWADDYDVRRVLKNRARLQKAYPYIAHPPKQSYRLLHVVNMALNLVRGKRLAWQQRRAQSFTASPLHSGTVFGGYRRTFDYGGKNGIRLGTAVAISGAAASSNMGYFSPSPFVTFVLTFFNARLGWWLGNPGVHGAETFFRSHPQSALSPIIDEAFGLTDNEHPYVLLSDGGHFENLGLYEMVLRRCRYIFVVDGSADPEGGYSDLGSAVRKIRIDFGVRIEFASPFPILARPESETKSGGYFAVGDIHYEDIDDPENKQLDPKLKRNKLTGRLVYIKPAIYNEEPRDIYSYAKGDETFPHESTADQFFDEPQFESHRVLGYYILEKLFDEAERASPADEVVYKRGDLGSFVEWLAGKAKAEKKAAENAERDKALTLFKAMLSSIPSAAGTSTKGNGGSDAKVKTTKQPPKRTK